MTNTQIFDTLIAENGLYTKDGIDYAITQVPYIMRYIASASTYVAAGIDRAGNEVLLTWDIVNAATEDESEACDWTVFEVSAI